MRGERGREEWEREAYHLLERAESIIQSAQAALYRREPAKAVEQSRIARCRLEEADALMLKAARASGAYRNGGES